MKDDDTNDFGATREDLIVVKEGCNEGKPVGELCEDDEARGNTKRSFVSDEGDLLLALVGRCVGKRTRARRRKNLRDPRNQDANGDGEARQGRESRLDALVRHEGQPRQNG